MLNDDALVRETLLQVAVPDELAWPAPAGAVTVAVAGQGAGSKVVNDCSPP